MSKTASSITKPTSFARWPGASSARARESNVRARGVFAVADSDEWSDKTTSGTFNSTLVSAPYALTAGRTATIGFGSHYLKEGSATATVSVSFNGGADTQILKYSADAVAKLEKLSVPIPSGATSMVVKWRLANGANNWYWAVDNPSVSVS